MAILPIYNCFLPPLKKKTAQVTEFDQELKDLVTDMFETMYNTGNGVGLAANQVGVDKSLIVLDLAISDDGAPGNPMVMINPIIKAMSEETAEETEGCLSVPEFYEKVARSKIIEVSYLDMDMKEINTTAEGFLARLMQHEIDHLNGILFFERLSPMRKTLSKNKLRKIQKGLIESEYPMVQPGKK